MDIDHIPENEMGFEGLEWCAETGVMKIYIDESGKPPSIICAVVGDEEYVFTLKGDVQPNRLVRFEDID